MPNTYSYDAAGNRTATGTGQALIENDAGFGRAYAGAWSRVTATGNASGST